MGEGEISANRALGEKRIFEHSDERGVFASCNSVRCDMRASEAHTGGAKQAGRNSGSRESDECGNQHGRRDRVLDLLFISIPVRKSAFPHTYDEIYFFFPSMFLRKGRLLARR